MPRQARLDAPGLLQHIIVRGIERGKIFLDDLDKVEFLTRLRTLLMEYRYKCYAWALLSNHFHLLLRTGEVPLSKLMRGLLTGYAVTFNRKYQRSGHLFQNRYKSTVCEEERYLLELVRYIHLNPLRAGIVKNIEELNKYPWTGHKNIIDDKDCKWQEIEEVLALFGQTEREAKEMYQRFMVEGIVKNKDEDLEGGGLIRSLGGLKEVLRGKGKQSYDERILGSSEFAERIIRDVEKKEDEKIELKGRLTEEALLDKVSRYYFLKEEALKGCSKRGNIVKARSLYCYLSSQYLGTSGEELSRRLKITPSGVSICIKRGEKIITENKELIESILN